MTDPVQSAICAAMGYHGHDWLEQACRAIEAHMRHRSRLVGVRAYELDTIGGRIKCARECLGMNQPTLAKRCGMPLQTLSKIENGSGKLPAIKVPGMAITLRVTAPWLLCATDEGGPEAKYNVRSPGKVQRWAREGLLDARARNAARRKVGSK